MGLVDRIFRKSNKPEPVTTPTDKDKPYPWADCKKHVPVKFHVTLWPSFPHFPRFSKDSRIQGIRLNSAMIEAAEINDTFVKLANNSKVPLWFDIKGMQLRVREVICDVDCDHLELRLNRPIETKTPCPVWFKGGEDCAELLEIKDGTHLIFRGGPKNEVRVGESLHIRNKDFKVGGPPLLGYELEKIERLKNIGCEKWYLSYVYDQKHVDAFREVIGPNAELILKIENVLGLEYVARRYKPMERTTLAAARGDLFVEVGQPHDVLNATKLIIAKDPAAIVGSRMLLSLVKDTVPSCADLCELAWLYEIGYRNFLLCDELCLKEAWLATAVNVFSAFRSDYPLLAEGNMPYIPPR